MEFVVKCDDFDEYNLAKTSQKFHLLVERFNGRFEVITIPIMKRNGEQSGEMQKMICRITLNDLAQLIELCNIYVGYFVIVSESNILLHDGYLE